MDKHKCGASDCDRMIEEPYKFCSIECAGYGGMVLSMYGNTYCRNCGAIHRSDELCPICV
jgi:hypothetical protein